MKLSICMMVKNEEKNLKRCLESLKHLRESFESELIIVDTGSTDNTVKIAMKYTERVYHKEWFNDFSGMRNITIGYAKGEWILIIDADEEIDDDSGIIQFLSSNESKKFKTAVIDVKNYTDIENNIFGTIESPRLFYNNDSFKYIGRVHNRPFCGSPAILLQSSLNHYGYVATDKELMERKFKRTSKLLKEEIERNPDDIYYNYQLSVSYGMHGEDDKALEQMKKTYKIIEDKKLDKKEYIYLYYEYAMYYFQSSEVDKYENSRRICEEGIELEDDYIDLYFLLGKINLIQSEFNKAEKNLNKYLELYKNLKKLPIERNTMVKLYTIDKIQECYSNIAVAYYSEKKYEDARKYIQKIEDNASIKRISECCISIFINLKDYEGMHEFYRDKIYGEKELDELFINQLEYHMRKLNNDDKNTIYSLFSSDMNDYSTLNELRVLKESKSEMYEQELDQVLNNLDLNIVPDYFGDLIYFKMKLKKDLSQDLLNVNQEKIISYIKYCLDVYEDFKDVMKEYIDQNEGSDYISIRLNRIFERDILVLNSEDIDVLSNYFEKYINDGISYVNAIYSEFVFKNELVYDVKNEEDGFFIYMSKAYEVQKSDLKKYLSYLKKSLEIYPCMRTGIKLLIEKSKKEMNKTNDEFESYKIQIKSSIKTLIENNKLEDAKKLIEQYEEIVKDDIEIVLLKSQISVKEVKNKANIDSQKYKI